MSSPPDRHPGPRSGAHLLPRPVRRLSALLLPLLTLAACGGRGQDNAQPGTEAWARNVIGNEGSPGFRRPDGSFDRADYRRVMPQGCAAGMRDGNPAIPAAEIDRFCTCLIDRMLEASSDAELFAMRRDEALRARRYDDAANACRPSRPYPSPPAAGEDEPPPPPEPAPLPPGQQSGTPPPVLQEIPPPPPPSRR